MEQRNDSANGWEQRYDRGELLAPVRLPNGTLVVEGFAAKEGVLVYRLPGGRTRRELVTFDCIEQSLDSLSDLPVTLHHPDPSKHPEGVTPQNVAELAVGNTGEVVKLLNGGHTKVHIAVRRQDGIDAIEKDGVRELSLGYAVQLDPTSGVHPVHGHYDAVQMRRVHNHLALVPHGRFGPDVGIRADGAYSIETITHNPGRTATGGAVKLSSLVAQLVAALGLSQQRFDTDEAALDGCVGALRARNDAAEREKQSHQAKFEQIEATHAAALQTLQAKHDAEKTRADGLQTKLTQLEAAETQRRDAAERAELENTAKSYGIEDPSKHQDSAELRRQVASKFLGREVRADEGEIYIRQIVKAAGDVVRTRSDGREAGRKAWEGSTETQTRQDNGPKLSPLQRARQRTDEARKGGEA